MSLTMSFLRKTTFGIVGFGLIAATSLAFMVAFGGPKPLPALDAVNKHFVGLSMAGLPAVSRFTARDGAALAYRAYTPAGTEKTLATVPPTATTPLVRAVLVHGSSASSQSMHPLAMGLSAAGFEGKTVLVGFSAGGGFALRFAASSEQSRVAHTVLLSPYLRYNAPTARPSNGGWVSVGLGRAVGLSVLNGFGITAFNGLTLTEFALNEQAKAFLTPRYSYRLATNFAPHRDYEGDIRAARGAVSIVAGQDDELFYADKFAEVFANAGKAVPVSLVAGLGHIPLTLKPEGIAAIVSACRAASI
jgi:pimeloyl-ACP methyl ester carboxylesterase